MNKKIAAALAAGLCSILVGYSQTKPQGKPQNKPKPMNEMVLKTQADRLSYAIGMNIAQGMKQQGLSDSLNIKAMAKAIEDLFKGTKMMLTNDEAQNIIQNFIMEQQQKTQADQQKSASKNLEEGKKFLEENKKNPGVVTLPSGLQYIVLKEGTGPIPKDTNTVTTHYHGTLINGDVFDSSVQRGQPASFPVNGVIRGWVEALKLMRVGSKWKLFVPSDLAYGPQSPSPKIGPNSTLIFEVELISIDK